MTRTFKRTGIFLLAVLMIVATLGASVSAANPFWEANPDQKGSITIHKYLIDGEPVTTPTNGLPIPANDPRLEGAEPLQRVGFTIQKIIQNDTSEPIGLDNMKADPAAGGPKTLRTDANGDVTFSNLDIGYYYVTEVANELITYKAAPFIIAIPMTNPENGHEVFYDVHAYPKNDFETEPEIRKSVTNYGNHAETIGQKVTEDGTTMISRDAHFILTAEIPSDVAEADLYAVNDTIDVRLTYKSNQNIVVTGYDNARQTNIVLTKNVDYTVKESSPSSPEFRVQFTQEGRTKLATLCPPEIEIVNPINGDLTYVRDDVKAMVDIEFECTANDLTNEETNMGVAIENKCELEYTNSFGYEHNKESNTVEVHTSGVKLLKVDAKNNNKVLPGAVFKLYNNRLDALMGRNAIKLVNGQDLTATANADGVAVFTSIPYGETGEAANSGANRKYWVAEVQAPRDPADGTKYYELLRTPFEVTVNSVSFLAENQIVVENSLPFVLPLTGLNGTTLPIIGGCIVVIALAGGAFYFIKKKNKKEDEAK